MLLGAERVITQGYEEHGKTGEDYLGLFRSPVRIEGTGRVIRVVNHYESYRDTVCYDDFFAKYPEWKQEDGYHCQTISGTTVVIPEGELGGNCCVIEGSIDGAYRTFGVYHLDQVFVSVGDIVNSQTVIGKQGNTGLVMSSKDRDDITYGTHIHFEVKDEKGNFLDPRPYAVGEMKLMNFEQNNGLDATRDQLKILQDQLPLYEQPQLGSKQVGTVYQGEIYDLLETYPEEEGTWYRITLRTAISGYLFLKTNENTLQLLPKEDDVNNGKVETTESVVFPSTNFEFVCPKDGEYAITLYQGEILRIFPSDNKS